MQTPSADDPIFVALSGTDAKPAVAGYDPGVGADLYITNGETTDYAHAATDTLGWTPELEEGCEGCGFVFPDDEALVQAAVREEPAVRARPRQSAREPGEPVSHLGNTTKPFYLDLVSDRPREGAQPARAIFASRLLRRLRSRSRCWPARASAPSTLKLPDQRRRRPERRPRPNGTAARRFGDDGRRLLPLICAASSPGTSRGDTVEVWFEGAERARQERLVHLHRAGPSRRARGLVVAAEDYTGISPVYKRPTGRATCRTTSTPSPPTASRRRLRRGRQRPEGARPPRRTRPLRRGHLVHGRRRHHARAGHGAPAPPRAWPTTRCSPCGQYLNEGGTLLYTGKYAGLGRTADGLRVRPEANAPCNPDDDGEDGCQPLSDDFIQYYLGAYLYNDGRRHDREREALRRHGRRRPVQRAWRGHSAARAPTTRTTAPRSSRRAGSCRRSTYPQFTSWASAKYVGPGGPFDPHTGAYYMYSHIADISTSG